jgi:flagellar biosynthesis/type III secretory pathway chaperone
MTMEGQAPNLEELQNNLKHQLSLYRQLVDLLREEKEHVIAVRFKEIREATYAKEAILDEVHREEFRRLKWTAEAARFLGVNEKEITMEMVATHIGGPTLFESLMSLKNALSHMLKKAKEMNLENKALVESALNDTQVMKRNILGLSSDKPQTYGPKGNMGGNGREQGARFLSKEA